MIRATGRTLSELRDQLDAQLLVVSSLPYLPSGPHLSRAVNFPLVPTYQTVSSANHAPGFVFFFSFSKLVTGTHHKDLKVSDGQE